MSLVSATKLFRTRGRGCAKRFAQLTAVLMSLGALTAGTKAADLDGDCCADLAEVIGDLSGKGNRKVTLTTTSGVPRLHVSDGNWSLVLPNLPGLVVTTSGLPFVLSGNRLAVVDPHAFAGAADAVKSVTAGVTRAVQGRLDDTGASGREAVPGRTVWSSAFGGYSRNRFSNIREPAYNTHGGALVGLDGTLAPGVTAGAFAGGAEARRDSEWDMGGRAATFALAGIYGRVRSGALFADLSLTGGWSEAERERLIASNVSGSPAWERAEARSDEWFTAPRAAVGFEVPLSKGVTFVPALRAGYTSLHVERHTERGSSTNMTIDARSIDSVEGRLEFAIKSRVDLVSGGRISTRAELGGLALSQLGGDHVSATLLNVPVTFSVPDAGSITGAYAGLHVVYEHSPSLRFTADAETTVARDHQAVVGHLGVSSGF